MGGPLLALAGGVGGAKLAWGLAQIIPPQELTIVVNTGDDEEFHGLHVSPDLDTVMYTLVGLVNPETGWGINGDTFNALEMLRGYGLPTWFRLGDRDLATHIHRTRLLREGRTLSQATRELCRSLGVKQSIAPMSDDPLRTIVVTDEGELPFQRYFVERRCEPRVKALRFDGADQARPSPEFEEALERAGALLFCPSNPFLSIAPILAVRGVKERIARHPGTRVAVSPIVRGEALRGPAAKMLSELGHDVSCVGVAGQYRGLCDLFVIDEQDSHHSEAIRELGMRPEVTQTIMSTEGDRVNLAASLRRLLKV